MDKPTVIRKCKELGCCDSCCLRFIGIKNPSAYANPLDFVNKYLIENDTKSIPNIKTENIPKEDVTDNMEVVDIDPKSDSETVIKKEELEETLSKEDKTDGNDLKTEIKKDKTDEIPPTEDNNGISSLSDLKNEMKKEISEETTPTEDETVRNGTSPPAKRRRSDICVSCLGILQENSWDECLEMVKEQLEKKRYECDSFACALSAPIAILLREKIITLQYLSAFEWYDPKCVTALKEAWKWSFGLKLEDYVKKTLVSGSTAPLLITVTIEYPDDLDELEILKTTSPKLFELRRQQKKRFAVEFTRRSVEEALDDLTADTLKQLSCSSPSSHVKCVSVLTSHVPCFLAGRYIKLSRELPQTPWLVGGQRMMESSVQEIIFEPIGKLYRMTAEAIESHLKLMSAGREDVDVRCLGEGRPFAIEILDPSRKLTEKELEDACEETSRTGKVIVKKLVYINKDDLALLKKGEETKTKCYQALCIKLTRSDNDDQHSPIQVTEQDIDNINSYSNTEENGSRVVIQQKTPIRVLHRRPLLTRTRRIHELTAEKVKGHPNLFLVRVVTEAGTYVKEWAHGELGRSSPALGTAMGARTDILALDVEAVNLPWPPMDGNTVKA